MPVMADMDPRGLIEQAIEIFGSQQKLAEACGVKQASIWQAKEAGRASAELSMAIEQATSGKVSARDLRPDLPWPDAPVATIAPAGATA